MPPISRLGGLTLDQAAPYVGKDRITYDVSPAILNIPAEYGTAGAQPLWTIVAGCVATGKFPGRVIAVIPTADVTPVIRAKARAGGYQSLLIECRGQITR
jgi:hypothetical protein